MSLFPSGMRPGEENCRIEGQSRRSPPPGFPESPTAVSLALSVITGVALQSRKWRRSIKRPQRRGGGSGVRPRKQQDEFSAPVLCPGRFVVARIDRFIFAIAARIDALRIDAEPKQLFAQGQRAAFAERAVVFLGPALIAMAGDAHRASRAALE